MADRVVLMFASGAIRVSGNVRRSSGARVMRGAGGDRRGTGGAVLGSPGIFRPTEPVRLNVLVAGFESWAVRVPEGYSRAKREYCELRYRSPK
ncbi:hypothetical protein GCM10009660_37760 [Catellatospora bangladeshensis]